jgi:N6-adenosine-specific RNA methylase IME4
MSRHQNLAILDLPTALTATSWNLPEGLTREQWVALGRKLVSCEKNIQWVLGALWIYGERSYGDGRALAEEIGVDYQTVRNYASVVRAFEIVPTRDNLSFGHHEAVAALPPPQRGQWLDRAEREGLTVAKLRQGIRREAAIAKTEVVGFSAKALGQFSVIYADPPWQYEQAMGDRSPENHYPTMPLEEICDLPVADIAYDDAVLFLWIPVPLIEQGLQVINAWGMVWVKDKRGLGLWVRQRAELLLIARRGDMPTPPHNARPDSVIEAPRLKHSAKPPGVYDIIDRMYPGLEKIELFARDWQARKNWKAWGNQT